MARNAQQNSDGPSLNYNSLVEPMEITSNEIDGEASSSSDAFESLQSYVDSLSNKDSDKSTFTCQLVDSSDTDYDTLLSSRNATITEINTIIFRPVNTADGTLYAVAIVPSSDKVDVRCFSEELQKLQQEQRQNGETYYDQWELAPSNSVQDLCGFKPGTIPPLLVPTNRNGSGSGGSDDKGRRRPFATILDSSLLNTTTWIGVADNPERLLLGGGGSVAHRCWIELDFLIGNVLEIDQPSSTRNTKIASIIRFDGGINNNNHNSKRGFPSGTEMNKNELEKDKPFFQIAPPEGSIGSVVPKGSGQPPHRPVPITAIGRLTSVRQIAKRLVFADFAPPEYDYDRWLANRTSSLSLDKTYNKTDNGMPGPPWRSGEDGKDMYVQIIVGKTFCERYEDGTERLKSLKPGKLVLVRGAANVDPMQKNGWRNSAGNWAQKRSLDVIVSSLEILDDDESDDSLRMLVEDAQREVASRGSSNNGNGNANWNSLLPWERKLAFERRAVGGRAAVSEEDKQHDPSASNNSDNNVDSANALTLNRFNSHLRDDPLDIKIVNNDDSIRAMAKDVSELFSKIDKDDQTTSSNLLEYVAGIDCEWRPTGAYAEALLEGPDDNPVALLQICLPAIGKVYLVDTHRTLRANLADTEAMTETESILSEAIGAIFGSEHVIKVGYSVAIDFRRLAGSFPHMPSFRSVRSVVELSTLAERLHPKSTRPLLGSLQKLTKLVLGYNITKEQQCSNWEARPLTSSQIEYATLDCALPPRLLDEMAEGSGNARTREVLPGVTKSWRFQSINGSQKDAIHRLKAKRVVGNTFVASQSWLNRESEPDPTSIPEEGGGPYTDTDGILKMPADLVSIGSDKDDARWKTMAGKTVENGKKRDCINLLVGNAMPEDAILDYNPRSGFIAFQDGLALFVNMPDPTRPSRRRMPYPNEWLEDGRILTWYIRKNDWDNGNSEIAKLLLGSNDDADSIPPASSSVVLFVRVGTNSFVCCGSCNATVADDDPSSANAKKGLIKLNLHLKNWEIIKDSTTAFSRLLEAGKATNNRSSRQEDPVSFRNRLAQAVVDGNIIGAFDMALDELKAIPSERSIVYGSSCVRAILAKSDNDDPLAIQAMEIIDGMKV